MHRNGGKMWVTVVGLFLVNSLIAADALDISLGSVVDSAVNVGKGVVKDAGNIVPSPSDIFEGSKQLIAGYPFELASSSINKICSSALASETISPKITPDIHKMNFQLRTACKNYSFPLLKADQMWKSPDFDPTKKVVILATGWTTTVNESDAIDVLAKAYNCRGDVNFVAVDAASFVDTLYSWSAFNTEEIGEHIARGLVELIKIVPLEKIHLMGHSLGAHIVGSAGRNFQYMTGKILPHITGLDPAKPCFNEGENLSGLLRGDAEFIDVIHSNPGVLGKREPLGDADFYPSGLDPLPEGCLSITCAHARAWMYYAETVYPGNEKNFMGTRCSSLGKLKGGKCPGAEYPMGYAMPKTMKGNYFLEINKEAPYGKAGNAEREKTNKSCGLCKRN